MTVSHESRVRVLDYYTHSDADSISTVKDSKQYEYEVEFADGSGNNQAQDMYRAQTTVKSKEEAAVDLAGGITDVFGNTITFATIKQLTIYNRSTTAGNKLIVGGASTGTTGNLLSDLFDGDTDARIKVQPGGILHIVAPRTGYTITGGSADVLRIYNDGVGDITFDIIVKGTR